MAEANLQWKNTDACYDFYCDCNADWPQHADGYFKQQFVCGSRIDPQDPEESAMKFCGKTWCLPNWLIALPEPPAENDIWMAGITAVMKGNTVPEERELTVKLMNEALYHESRRRGYCLCIHDFMSVIDFSGTSCAWCEQPVTAQSYGPEAKAIRTEAIKQAYPWAVKK